MKMHGETIKTIPRILGSDKQSTGQWRKLRDEELTNSFVSQKTNREIKPKMK